MFGSPNKVDEKQALINSQKLIEQAAKRMRLKRIVPKVSVEVNQSVLVIGGGAAGLEASLDLADKGYKVLVARWHCFTRFFPQMIVPLAYWRLRPRMPISIRT